MDGSAAYNPRTVEEVFRDFKGRRTGVIKALTTGTFIVSLIFFVTYVIFSPFKLFRLIEFCLL